MTHHDAGPPDDEQRELFDSAAPPVTGLRGIDEYLIARRAWHCGALDELRHFTESVRVTPIAQPTEESTDDE